MFLDAGSENNQHKWQNVVTRHLVVIMMMMYWYRDVHHKFRQCRSV